MRVEITEARLRDAGFSLVEGDAITVPDEVGTKWCGLGWAKDTEGNVPTGERKVRGATVDVQNVRHPTTTEEG